MVEDYISITLMTCCEDDDLTDLRHFFQKLLGIWTDIDSRIDELSSWKFDLESDIMRKAQILIAMNQGLVKIQNEGIFMFAGRQINRMSLKFFICRFSVVFKVL